MLITIDILHLIFLDVLQTLTNAFKTDKADPKKLSHLLDITQQQVVLLPPGTFSVLPESDWTF